MVQQDMIKQNMIQHGKVFVRAGFKTPIPLMGGVSYSGPFLTT
jgi:hypothetical protein